MKITTFPSLVTLSLLSALALPLSSVAQQSRYNLIDIPTLGGPAAIGQVDGVGISQFINNPGVVVGGSDTLIPDPTAPGCNDCFLVHAFQWQDGTLRDLGALPGVNFSHAMSVNARGWATGGSYTGRIDPLKGDISERAVLWRDGGVLDLGTLGSGIESAALYVNDAGEVVGFSTIDMTLDSFAAIGLGPFPEHAHGFIWRNGIMRDLGTLGGPDAFVSGGCNNQHPGLVAGESFLNATPNVSTGFPTLHPFLWNNGTMTDLGSLGGTVSTALCANNQSQVTGQSSLTGDVNCLFGNPLFTCNQHAFFWDHGSMTDLGTLGGSFSQAVWLNNIGEVVGGATTTNDDSFHATLWSNGQVTDLGTLDGDCFSIANSINSSGLIIGQSFSCDFSVSRAVAWQNGQIFDLNAAVPPNSGLLLAETDNLNDRGEIVGRSLPAGCDNADVCGRIFLLVPCHGTSAQPCPAMNLAAETNTAAVIPGAPLTRQFVAKIRARHSTSFRKK